MLSLFCASVDGAYVSELFVVSLTQKKSLHRTLIMYASHIPQS